MSKNMLFVLEKLPLLKGSTNVLNALYKSSDFINYSLKKQQT